MNRFAALLSVVVFLTGCSQSRQAATSVSQPPAIRVRGGQNVIPASTTVEVRTNEAIASSSAQDRTYAAEIATDIRDESDKVLVPKGSPVELVVLEAKEKSGVRGPSLQLGMRSVTVDGKTYLVVSQELQQSTGLGKNRRTAETVGTGAALGTLIGAVAGGGKGAVIGAVAGAAAGAAVQVMTQGKEVRVPAETILNFRLNEPIHLQP